MNTKTHTPKRIAVTAVAAALLLAGCGSSSVYLTPASMHENAPTLPNGPGLLNMGTLEQRLQTTQGLTGASCFRIAISTADCSASGQTFTVAVTPDGNIVVSGR